MGSALSGLDAGHNAAVPFSFCRHDADACINLLRTIIDDSGRVPVFAIWIGTEGHFANAHICITIGRSTTGRAGPGFCVASQLGGAPALVGVERLGIARCAG